MTAGLRGGSAAVGLRAGFVGLVSLGAWCWVGSLLSWVAFAFFMAVGGDSAGPLPVGCVACLEEGIPSSREWVGIAWVLGPALAVGSGIARVFRAPRTSAALAWAAVLAAALALGAMVVGAESARDFWVRYRFEQGAPAAPVVGLVIQHQHTACAVVAAATLVAVALFLGLTRQARVPAPLTIAGVAQLAACALAWRWVQWDQPDQPLSSLLRELGALVPAVARGAFVVTSLAGALWVYRGEAPHRRHWVGLLAWVTLGALLRFSTFTYDADLRDPPPLRPLARQLEPWPWVERCIALEVVAARVIQVSDGGTVVIDGRSGTRVDELERSLADEHASGADRVLRVAAAELDFDVQPLDPYLGAALRHGVRDAELVVQQRLRFPSATYGLIHDRRTCAVRVPIRRLLGASTYGEMLDRAGARASSRPPPDLLIE